ncbi:cyclic di-GMP phosphodiesterase response regulator RpfG [mine drainage metagenome]|uniref:Cyclic di-GMP phosphodiesterase response regulator RpfG n=1 Tax=mine drainage metagenome TaxID=410659 RepID=A0A1J5S4D0_9ZZZZ
MNILSSELKIKLFDMVLCFSRALDLLHPEIADHHLRVAYIACCIAETMGFAADEIQNVLIAGALHDAGAASSATRLRLLDYALGNYRLDGSKIQEDIHEHAFKGSELIKDFPPFSQAASAIRFHHVEWNFGRGREFAGVPVPLTASILYLADRVAVMPMKDGNILEQAAEIRRAVGTDTGRWFMPEVAAAFQEASAPESFWLDVTYPHKEAIIVDRFGAHEIELNLDALHELAKMFRKVIDYRSPFTATHSSGVAAVAEVLGQHLGFSSADSKLLRIAGYLHDIGKLAVPSEILNKPGNLTEAEMLVVKQHPYYTFRILSTVPGLETINTLASLHHERLDRRGYPFRSREIPLGSRIIAVADIFTAITEDRPYRRGMDRARSFEVMDQMVLDGAIDGGVAAALQQNYDAFERVRNLSQER